MLKFILSLLSLFKKGASMPPTPVIISIQPDPVIQPVLPNPDPILQPPSTVITVGLDYQLSPHFTFGMLTKTEHREWIDKNREEAQKYLKTLFLLAKEILEPVYTLMGSLFVTSCFRCRGLNSAIGGATTSQHCDAEACDMEFQGATEGQPLKEAFNKIAFSNIQYSQIIFENPISNAPQS